MKIKIICIIIGCVYILSGIGKVTNVVAFEILIANYGFEHLQILAPFIILGELALGVCLVLWIKPKLMSLLSVILLLIFTTAFVYAHFKNGITDCGCFGMLNLNQQSPIFTYMRNILLIGMSLLVFVKSQKEDQLIENKSVPILFIVFLTFVRIVGIQSRTTKISKAVVRLIAL